MKDSRWMLLDDVLCELIDRLGKSGYKHTLEVELQAKFVELDKCAVIRYEEFLSKFREKGRVSVMDLMTGEPRWEWS